MSIKIFVRDLHAAIEAIDKLPRIPSAKVSYEIGYIGDKLQQHQRNAERERIKLVKELSIVGEGGKRSIPPEKLDEFNERFEKILDVEVELQRNPIKLSDLIGDKPERQPEIEPGLLRHLAAIIVE